MMRHFFALLAGASAPAVAFRLAVAALAFALGAVRTRRGWAFGLGASHFGRKGLHGTGVKSQQVRERERETERLRERETYREIQYKFKENIN